MRPKCVALVIGITAFLIAGLSALRQHDQSKDSAADAISRQSLPAGGMQETAQTPDPTKTIPTDTEGTIVGTRPTNGTTSTTAPKSVAASETLSHEEYIEQRVGELMDLGMSDDPSSLKTILSEVNNAEPEIRKAAIEAAKQFGSADAIP